MKKIILSLFLLFSITSINANASNSYCMINDIEFDQNDSLILESGYYILSQSMEYIDSTMFKGDFQGGIRSSGDKLTLADVKSKVFVNSEHESNINQMLNEINYDFNDYFYDDIYILKVNSSAIFINLCGTYLEHFFVYGYKISPKSDMTISGNMTHFISVDNMLPLDQIKARYSAYDNVDKDISNRLEFESNYNQNNTVGKYYIIASVSDLAGNRTVSIDYIIVKDLTNPTIYLEQSPYIVNVYDEITTNQILNNFIVNDNFSPKDKLVKTIVENTYQDQFNKVGEYTISCYVSDENKNRSDIVSLKVIVQDNINPVITLTAGGSTIIANHVLNNDEIKALLTVTDNYYSLSPNEITITSNTCTGEQGKNYQLTVTITDGSGNVGESTFDYYLSDTVSPIIRVEKTLYVEYGKEYTNEQIIQMLKDAGLINIDSTNVSISTKYKETINNQEIYELTYKEITVNGELISTT